MARKLGVGVENVVSEMLLESLLGQGVLSYPKALSSQGRLCTHYKVFLTSRKAPSSSENQMSLHEPQFQIRVFKRVRKLKSC